VEWEVVGGNEVLGKKTYPNIKTTQRHILIDHNVGVHRYGNLKSVLTQFLTQLSKNFWQKFIYRPKNIKLYTTLCGIAICRMCSPQFRTLNWYSMRQNIQYWNKKTNNITLLSSVSLFLMKETNIHTISVLIYHGMHNVSVRSVHSLAVDSFHIVRDARISVLYILAHTVLMFCFFNSGLWGYWHCGHSWPIVPASGDSSEDDCGEADGM
jgi:hypothetical protein